MLSLNPPSSFKYHLPSILYYSHTSGCEYLILVPNSSESKSCIKYEFKSNQYIEFAPYPKKFIKQNLKHPYIGAALNNNKLYVYCWDTIFIWNLSDDKCIEWTSVKPNIDSFHWQRKDYGIDIESMIFSHNDKNETILHVLSRQEKYFQYNPNNNEMSELKLKRYHNFDATRSFLYNQYQQTMHILRVNNNRILELNLNVPTDSFTKGEQSDIILPNTLMDFNYGGQCRAFLALNARLLVIVDLLWGTVYSMDLRNQNYLIQNEWHVRDFDEWSFSEFSMLSIVLTNYTDIHFINVKNILYHAKISLWSLLPLEILEKYAKPLVKRYTGSVAKQMYIPDDITSVIITFL